MTASPDHTLQLSGGRLLGYRERGDPAGLPLLLFHGMPGSRLDLEHLGVHEALRARGLRGIALDRPGIGLSEPLPKRRVLDWPADVRAFADARGIGRFAVLGFSAGGVYALACARSLGDRLLAAGVVAGPAPPGVAALDPALSPARRRHQRLARWAPGLLRRQARRLGAAIGGPHASADEVVPNAADVDRAVLADESLRAGWLASWREAFRQGADGPWWDQVLIARPWGFAPGEIAMPIQLWIGGMDQQTPPALGRHLAGSLQRSEARLYPGEGHFSLLARRLGEILDGVGVAVGRVESQPR